jgi:hypothetical protein
VTGEKPPLPPGKNPFAVHLNNNNNNNNKELKSKVKLSP